jgi:hypothetical protein
MLPLRVSRPGRTPHRQPRTRCERWGWLLCITTGSSAREGTPRHRTVALSARCGCRCPGLGSGPHCMVHRLRDILKLLDGYSIAVQIQMSGMTSTLDPTTHGSISWTPRGHPVATPPQGGQECPVARWQWRDSITHSIEIRARQCRSIISRTWCRCECPG